MNARNTLWLKRCLRWCAVLFPAAALAAAFFVDGWPAQRFLVFYVAPLFLAAPLWVELRIDESGVTLSKRTVVDALVFLLSLLRFVLGEVLPFSGHMLFLTYSGLTTTARWYRWLALVLLAETTVFKLWLWRDVYSWSLGLVIGLVAAAWVGRQR